MRFLARRDVDYVIHCASPRALNLGIKDALQQTFLPTRTLLQLVRQQSLARAARKSSISCCSSASASMCYWSITQCKLQASVLPRVRAFTYLSTAFVNSGLPPGWVVEECIYPLAVHEPGQAVGAPIDGLALAERLLGMSDEDAQAEARGRSVLLLSPEYQWMYETLVQSKLCCSAARLAGMLMRLSMPLHCP